MAHNNNITNKLKHFQKIEKIKKRIWFILRKGNNLVYTSPNASIWSDEDFSIKASDLQLGYDKNLQELLLSQVEELGQAINDGIENKDEDIDNDQGLKIDFYDTVKDNSYEGDIPF